jgi:hypothetical protein
VLVTHFGGEGLAGSVDAQAARPITNPDELFRLGRFKEVDRAYRRLLRKTPRTQISRG